jgi:hypothetical protein
MDEKPNYLVMDFLNQLCDRFGDNARIKTDVFEFTFPEVRSHIHRRTKFGPGLYERISSMYQEQRGSKDPLLL